MKYILILTLAFGNAYHKSGQGGAAVAMHEFNSIEMCRGAGEMWKKRNNVSRYDYMKDDVHLNYLCVPKGK